MIKRILRILRNLFQENQEVRVLKLHHNATLPNYSQEGDAGMDLVATSYEYDPNRKVHIYGLGIAMEIPEGYVGLIFPRSSNSKKNLTLCNSVGVIDSGYRGEIKAMFREIPSPKDEKYLVGDKVCQIIIVPYPKIKITQVKELSSTKRGTGGFGSTGR